MRIIVLGFLIQSLAAFAGTAQPSAIPFDRLGTQAETQVAGDAISVTASPGGALLKAAFQDLEAQATVDGLWLRSTAEEHAAHSDRFRVRATATGRSGSMAALPSRGTVLVAENSASFERGDLIEEYSVSMDGVRQDFLLSRKPMGDGDLRVSLEVSGARVESAAYGAKLVLESSGRAIAYHRLLVNDADDRKLEARFEIDSSNALVIVVNDEKAVYPLRIDPTFCDCDWISMGGTPGTDGTVLAITPDTAGNLYVGGTFTTAGGVPAFNVAKWDGSSWSAMGDGVFGTVRALAVSGSLVYAGGDIGSGVVCWNGDSWSPLREGTNGPVLALAASGSTLYVGGNFTTAGTLSSANVASWSGGNWSALGSGTNGAVNTMIASGGNLYIGGAFHSAGGVSGTSRVARWSGSAWSALGIGMDGNVDDLVIGGDYLYAGGQFNQADGLPTVWLARWNIVSSGWSAIAHPASGTLLTSPGCLTWSGGQLYVGSTYVIAADTHTIVKWNPGTAAWSTLPATPNNPVQVLTAVGGQVYAGGGFSYVGATGASNIVRFDGSAWHGMGGGFNGQIHALAALGSDLYVGGLFRSTPTGSAQYIAKWNGSTWSALGSGTNGGVSALAVWNGSLYVGGDFTHAGGLVANYVARWIPTSSSWSLLVPPIFGTSAGTDGPVNALAAAGTKLYVGGSFSTASDLPHEAIAAWDGASWSALGTGIPGTVSALAVSGSDLFVGGNFPNAGGAAGTQNIARWNGSAWSALGSSGTDSGVRALAVSGSNLYAGGIFSQVNGVPAANVARWNGSVWSPLGVGTGGVVRALAVSGNDLFVGGDFTVAGAIAADHIAKWDSLTSEWSGLGTGMNDVVRALAVAGGRLYAGGDFTTAGGKISPMLASTTLARYSDGSLDEGFGTGGVVVTDFGTVPSSYFDMKIQDNGRILVAGISGLLGDTEYVLVRYLPSGALDSSFATGGRMVADFRVASIALQADGKILVAGSSWVGPNIDFILARYLPNGEPDPDFGTSGKVFTDFSSNSDHAYSVTLQTDGKILVAGRAGDYPNSDFALARYDSSGLLDPGFSSDGKLTTDFGYVDEANDIVVQPDGMIVLVGRSGADFAMARYVSNGDLDGDFGVAGKVISDIGYSDNALSVALQMDGRIVVAGSYTSSPWLLALACYTGAGQLDSNFGTGGIVLNDAVGALLFLKVAVQADGKILVPVLKYGTAVLRYTHTGLLDSEFGLGGEAASGVPADGWQAAAIQSDGKIVVAGHVGASSASKFAIARYAWDPNISLLGNGIEIADGDTTPDPADDTDMGAAPIGGGTSSSFIIRNTGSEPLTLSGGPTTRVTISPADGPFAIAAQYLPETIDPCGGETFFSVIFSPTLSEHVGFQTATVTVHSDDDDESPYTFTVRACGIASVFSDGRLDPTFDSDGKVTTTLGGLNGDFGYAAAEQSDGKIVVAGSTNSGGNADFLLARYRLDGSLDPDFGTGGIVTTPVGTGSDAAWAVVIQTDGKILAAGSATTAGNEDFALVRYLPNGTPDPVFGIGGKVTTDIGGFSDIAFALALQNDGLIVVAGRSFNGSNQDFAVVRYLPNGVVDATFAGGGGRYNFTGGNDEAHEVLVQGDGMIVLAGSSGDDFGLLRLDAYGVLDPAFGSFGRVTTDFGGASDQGYGAVIVGEGNILVAGASNGLVALARYLSDGTLDPTFGTGGKTTSHSGIAYDVAVQPDGKIVTGGWYFNASHSDFLLARFLADGSPDTTLDGDGIVIVNLTSGLPNDTARAVIPTCDGQLVLAGTSSNGSDSDIALTRHAVAPMPEIRVEGNTRGILSGDTTPSLTDHTDFGSVSLGNTLTRTFTITNTGSADLHLTGGPGAYVVITSLPGAPFTVSAQPASGTIGTSGALTFEVTFAPTSVAHTGPQFATVTIASDDFDESSYTFNFAANGVLFSDGSLDPTFGLGGKVKTDFGGTDFGICHALLPDGRILVAGSSAVGADGDFAIVRYLPDGQIDPTFGVGGKVTTDFSGGDDTAYSVALLPDGRFVVAGYATTLGDKDIAVAQYLESGDLDFSFGTSGKVTTDLGGDLETGYRILLQTDGKLLVAGEAGDLASSSDFALLRYSESGSLDPGFGIGGKAIADFNGGIDWAFCLALQADGRIIVAGIAENGGLGDFALIRYDSTGTTDGTFGVAGKVTTNFGGDDVIYSVAVQDDGRIVVAGAATPGTDRDFGLARYLENGSPDPSFGTDGKVTTDFGGIADSGVGLTIQSDGKIVAAGVFSDGVIGDFAIARYAANGTLDPFFGTNGKVTTDFGDSFDAANFVSLQPDGRILVCGFSEDAGGTDFALARYAWSDRDIAVSGNSVDISDGDTTPDTADHSDFGSTCAVAGSVVRVFTITNSGPGNLNLTGSQLVEINGDYSDDFVVTTLPSSPVAGGASTTFEITFIPTDVGLRTAMVSITCDDLDESPFTFAIQGIGLTHAEVFEQKMLAAGLAVGSTAPLATPFGDGVPNLLKYAFNLNLNGPDVRILPAGGTVGLPRITLEGNGASRVLRYEFVGRADCLELTYAAKKSTDLAPDLWLPLDDEPLITPLVGDWARIVYEEPAPEGTTPRLFGRVEVELP